MEITLSTAAIGHIKIKQLPDSNEIKKKQENNPVTKMLGDITV
jgi:hypothetical protein